MTKVIPKSLFRYSLVGIGSNIFVFLVFLVFLWLGISAFWAAAICYIIGLTLSYTFNRQWSFESTASHRSDLVRFLFAYGAGLVATLVFITVLTMFLRPEIAQILNIGLTAVVIYACLTIIGFGKGV